MKKKIYISLLFVLISVSLCAQVLTVEITGIRNNKGSIRLAFFTDNTSFRNDNPEFEKVLSKKNMENNSITVSFDKIPPGTYGIAMLDDEDEDGKMRYNFLGVPREGFGFSNLYHTGYRRPSFDDFKFKFFENKSVQIRVRYM